MAWWSQGIGVGGFIFSSRNMRWHWLWVVLILWFSSMYTFLRLYGLLTALYLGRRHWSPVHGSSGSGLLIVRHSSFSCPSVHDCCRSLNPVSFPSPSQCRAQHSVGTKEKGGRTWWLGKIRLSARTTFSFRPAANTTTSAISSGVNGSTPSYTLSAWLLSP